MKWLKHMTNSRRDERLVSIIDEHGIEGYGFYWMLLETVAESMDESDKCSLTYSLAQWARLTYCHHNKVSKYLEALHGNGLVIVEYVGSNGEVTAKSKESKIRVKIPNLLKVRDNHTKNLQAKNKQEVEEVEPEVDTKNNSTHFDQPIVGAAPEIPDAPPPAVVVEQFALAPTELDPGQELFLQFPLNDGTPYHVTMGMVAEWQGYYPAVDVPQQMRNLLGWCQANPTKRKTRRGFPAFVTNALSRKQDQAGNRPAYRESTTDRRSRIDAALFGNEPAGYAADDYRAGVTIEQ